MGVPKEEVVLSWWQRWRLNPWGLILGGFMFASASTPSLLPRTFLYQGLASGLSAVSGYALGLFLHWNWHTWAREVAQLLWKKFSDSWGISLPKFSISQRSRFWAEIALIVALVLILLLVTIDSIRWQRELHELMGMDQDSTWNLIWVVPLGIAVWLLVLFAAHLVMSLARFIIRITPDSWTVSSKVFLTWVLVILLLIWSIDSLIPGTVVRTTERAFAAQNEAYAEDLPQVHHWQRSGSPQSLNDWEGLGTAGARYVSQGLHAGELEELTGRRSKEPIRVYSGLGHGESDVERSQRLVAELERTGAQNRAAIMVAGTTGTGWVNPTAMQSLELLYDGDTAIAAAQYSFFPSPVQFVSDRDRVEESGRLMIGAIVDWWNGLPEDQRPELYIFGESLGSTQGEGAFSGIRDITNSVDGIFFVGPPNGNDLWSTLVQRRDPGSREIAPEYSGGQIVRFAENDEDIQAQIAAGQSWSHPRVLYLQHASDPIVWWSPSLLFKEPDWLVEEPGQGRHPEMTWRPLVTFWQVSIDLLNSVEVPDGYGHNYGTAVLDGLAAITGRGGDLEELRAQLLRAMLLRQI